MALRASNIQAATRQALTGFLRLRRRLLPTVMMEVGAVAAEAEAEAAVEAAAVVVVVVVVAAGQAPVTRKIPLGTQVIQVEGIRAEVIRRRQIQETQTRHLEIIR